MRERRSGARARRRRRIEGMTLIEVMVTMLIIALISSAAGYVVMNVVIEARVRQADADARQVSSVATAYVLQSPGDCPSVDDLVRAGLLSTRQRTTDPWGHAFVIDCEGNEPLARSAGPDGQFQTEDDVP